MRLTIKVITYIWTVFIFYLSHVSGTTTSRQSYSIARITRINELFLRKIAHVICYLVLGVLGSLSYGCSWYVLAFLFIIAIADEATKRFVVDRHSTFSEGMLNCLGALIGYLFVIFICRFLV